MLETNSGFKHRKLELCLQITSTCSAFIREILGFPNKKRNHHFKDMLDKSQKLDDAVFLKTVCLYVVRGAQPLSSLKTNCLSIYDQEMLP